MDEAVPTPAACVPINMGTVMAATWLGWISTFSGVNVQEDWSGSPEQESVTNRGEASAVLLTGVTETWMVPDAPGMSVSVAGATETLNPGTALD
jgi:hypothetical protein